MKLTNRDEFRETHVNKYPRKCHPRVYEAIDFHWYARIQRRYDYLISKIYSIFSYDAYPYNKFKHSECNHPPLLSITTIIPPENLISFNTGSSLEKWKKKIPRLKSSKSARSKPVSVDSTETDASDAIDNSNDAAVEQQFDRVNSVEEKDESEYEVDPDVQRLLYEARQNEADGEIQKTRPKHKRKKAVGKRQDSLDNDQNKHAKSKRRTKVIRFSLSKPPSPETIQVIRVDVTSNYSIEDAENIGNESEAAESRVERTGKLATNSGNMKTECKSSDAFILKCEKLALSDRK